MAQVPVKVEAFLGSWIDITPYVYLRDPLEIIRGRSDEAGTVEASSCTFTLNNRDGRFSPRNPVGPYYGLIGRNTPVRVTIEADNGVAFDAASNPGVVIATDFSWTHTPAGTPRGVLVFVAQNVQTPAKVLKVAYGGIELSQVPLSPLIGDSGAETGTCYAYFLGHDVPPGAQTVTVDVDDTGSFKATMAMTVTADNDVVVDDTVTLNTTTADPSATFTTTGKAFLAGVLHSGQDDLTGTTPAAGYTESSPVDFTAQTASFIYRSNVDPGSPTIGWTATNEEAHVLGVAVKVARERFYGEVVAWPQQWDASGADVYVPVEAAGIMRRLGQGATPLHSAPHRFAVSHAAFAYWPLDEGTRAQLGTPVIGSHSFTLRRRGSSSISPGAGELAPWLPNGVEVNESAAGAVLDGRIGMPTSVTSWAVDAAYSGDDLGIVSYAVFDRDGSVIWRVRLDPSINEISLLLRTGGTNSTENTIETLTSDPAFDGNLHVLRLWTRQNGSNADYRIYLDGVQLVSDITAAAITQDGVGSVALRGTVGSGNSKVNFAHIAVWDTIDITQADPDALAWSDAVFGHQGEKSAMRIQRLCAEEGIAFGAVGSIGDSAPLGPQYPETFLDIIREAAETDAGILYEPREFAGLAFRSRASLYNQPPSLSLNYTAGVFGSAPAPVDDDQATRNDVTVAQRDGSSARAILESGPLSVQNPPNGVGSYDEQITVNAAGEGKMLEDQAGWRLRLGTVDEPRYPLLHLSLASTGFAFNAALALAAAQLDIGDRVAVNGLPTWVSFDQVNVIAQGFTETVEDGIQRDIFLNCTPETPWRVAVYQSGAGSTVHKYDSGGSTLSALVTSTATSLSVATATGHPLWTADDAEDGFDIFIGGERMTVTDISGAASPQTFSVTRSVNSVIKAHSAGAAVRLWQTPTYAL